MYSPKGQKRNLIFHLYTRVNVLSVGVRCIRGRWIEYRRNLFLEMGWACDIVCAVSEGPLGTVAVVWMGEEC